MTFPMLTWDEVKKGCGAGQGSNCCKFIVVGAEGPECARESMPGLADRKMSAGRVPTLPYPDCQLKETIQ